MVEFEELLTPRAVAERTHGAYSEEAIRAACHRGSVRHPLPHIRSGAKRPHIKIAWTEFVKWHDEEQRMAKRA